MLQDTKLLRIFQVWSNPDWQIAKPLESGFSPSRTLPHCSDTTAYCPNALNYSLRQPTSWRHQLCGEGAKLPAFVWGSDWLRPAVSLGQSCPEPPVYIFARTEDSGLPRQRPTAHCTLVTHWASGDSLWGIRMIWALGACQWEIHTDESHKSPSSSFGRVEEGQDRQVNKQGRGSK